MKSPKSPKSSPPPSRSAEAAGRMIAFVDEAAAGKKRATLEGGAWGPVDVRMKDEVARRQPPRALNRRAEQIADVLDVHFPQARCALHYRTPLQLLLATILSAQCTDVRVNLVTPGLFAKYPAPEDFASAPPGELEQDIRSTGFFNNKAKSIRSCCCELIERHGGEVPVGMEELSALPGVGRKTASVVRANAFGLPGITVDTHFQRIMQRLGLTQEQDPERIEFDIGSLLPPERWSQFCHAVILHGRKTCKARKPDCAACPLQTLCPTAGQWE